jgi:hypothetical protein
LTPPAAGPAQRPAILWRRESPRISGADESFWSKYRGRRVRDRDRRRIGRISLTHTQCHTQSFNLFHPLNHSRPPALLLQVHLSTLWQIRNARPVNRLTQVPGAGQAKLANRDYELSSKQPRRLRQAASRTLYRPDRAREAVGSKLLHFSVLQCCGREPSRRNDSSDLRNQRPSTSSAMRRRPAFAARMC